MNQKLTDVQAEFRKGRRTRDQIDNIHWIMEKQENSRKTSTSASLTMLKPLIVWIPWEDPLEKGMASIPAWRIPWTEEPGGIQTMGSQTVGHD